MFYRTLIFAIAISQLLACHGGDKSLSGSLGQKEPVDSLQIPAQPNFNEHVANIIYTKCASCHRPGSSGPFNLLSYDDVYRRKKTIVKVTQSGYMPPWPADRHYSSFVGELFLSSSEKEILKRWVGQGAIEGPSEIKPIVPRFPEGSQLGKPDLVIKMPKVFRLAGNNRDHYVIMKLPFEIPADQYVRAMEFVPGNRKRVHHVNGYLINYEDGEKKNLHGGSYFVNNYESSMEEVWRNLDVLTDAGTYPERIPSATNYLPGVSPAVYPEGIGGFQMKKKGHVIFNDIHYGPTPKEEYDNSYVNVFFTKSPPERKFGEFQLGTYGVSPVEPKLLIPPDSIKTFTCRYTVQEDLSLLTINPHMHLLGKSFIAYAITPEGENIHLIKIDRWDFRWQYFYTFKTMLKIPKGSTIYVKATFDNTSQNPNNPFNPPQWVGEREGSMSTKDEMLQFIVTYLPYQPGDEQISLESSTNVNKYQVP